MLTAQAVLGWCSERTLRERPCRPAAVAITAETQPAGFREVCGSGQVECSPALI